MIRSSLSRGAWTRPAREPYPEIPGALLPKPRRAVKEPSVLRSTSRLKAKKPMRRLNPARKAKKFERQFGEHGAFIRSLACAVRLLPCCRENRWKIHPAHVKATGMGGCKGDWRDLIPLSADLHLEVQHRMTIEQFEARYEIPFRALRHVLVVADPAVEVAEQLIAWRRLHEEHPAHEVQAALQRGLDLCGYLIEPPKVAEEVACG